MKLWKKIFLYSVGLFTVLYCTTGVLMVEKTHGEKLRKEISLVLNKCTDIEYNLYLNVDYLVYTDFSDIDSLRKWLEILINGYFMDDVMGTFQVEVYTMDNELILSNASFDIPGPRKELEEASREEKTFLVRKVDGERTVFVSKVINLNTTEVELVVSRNIESIYDGRLSEYSFFAVVGLGMLGILSSGMYIIAKHLTGPIESLSDASKQIAKGDYNTRVKESCQYEEVGVLQKNFNSMAEVIKKNLEELEYMNEAKQRFIDSLSHEIKTPITSIIGYSDLLLVGKVSEEVRIKSLRYINQEAKRLEYLNTTLMRLIIYREEEKKQEPVSMKECINYAAATLRFKLEQKGIELDLRVDDGIVIGDGTQFVVLIGNLLDNAIKASDEGGKIEIRGEVSKGRYSVLIKDYGIGILKEDIDKIFEPFYMVDKARTRKNNGVGLGLAICQDICKNYGIKLEIKSEYSHGTEVSVLFQMEDGR